MLLISGAWLLPSKLYQKHEALNLTGKALTLVNGGLTFVYLLKYLPNAASDRAENEVALTIASKIQSIFTLLCAIAGEMIPAFGQPINSVTAHELTDSQRIGSPHDSI